MTAYDQTISLLAPLENLTSEGWTTVSGGSTGATDDQNSVPALATAGPDGGPCVRLTVGVTGTHRRIKKTPANSGGLPAMGTFAFWVKTDYHADLQIAVFAFRAADAGYYQGFFNLNDAKSVANSHDGEWFLFKCNGGQLAAADGAPAWVNGQLIDEFQIGIYPRTSPSVGTYTCHFADFYVSAKTRPKVMITFDDSNDTDLTVAAPYLADLGFSATTYTLVDEIGTANSLTEANLDTLKNTYGWCIASHGPTDLTTLSQAARLADLESVRDWMKARGHTTWRHYAYPLGFHNLSTAADMATVGFFTGRATDSSPDVRAIEPDLLRLPGWGTAEKTLAQFMTTLNNTVTYGLTWHIFSHGLYNYSGGTNATHTDLNTWKSMMDQLKIYSDQGLIDVVTVDEWHRALTATAGATFATGKLDSYLSNDGWVVGEFTPETSLDPFTLGNDGYEQ